MEFGLYCDSCQNNFDPSTRIPLILPQCGHTICRDCAQIAQRDSYCKLCNSPQQIDDFSLLKINQKLYAVVQATNKSKRALSPPLLVEDSPVHSKQAEPHSANQLPLKQIYSFQQSSPNVRAVGGQKGKMMDLSAAKSINTLKNVEPSHEKAYSYFTQGQETEHTVQTIEYKLTSQNLHPESGFFSSSMRSQSTANIPLGKTTLGKVVTSAKPFCGIHLDKPIEYFCRQCNKSVCSKCMFHHHNGHELSQIDEALKNIYTHIRDFDLKITETVKDHEETKSALQKHKAEIENMKERQKQLIEKKFADLFAKLEERKIAITKEMVTKYENALFKINDKIRSFSTQTDEVTAMQAQYEPVFKKLKDQSFLDQEGSQAQIEILNKIPQYEEMILEWSQKVKVFLQSSRNAKIEISGGETLGLKPVDVSVQNALSLIQTIQLDNHSISVEYQLPPFAGKKHKNYNITQESTEIAMANTSFNYNGRSLIQVKPSLAASRSKSNHDQESQQQPQFNSKFAKMRFQRQASNASDELQLQLDTPSVKQVQTAPARNEQPSEASQQLISNISNDKNEDSKLSEDEVYSQKLKVQDNAIFCVGDTRFTLMFDYKQSQWSKVYFDKQESDYQGMLKFMSICLVSQKRREFIMTGGCNKISLEASNSCYRFSLPTIRIFREVKGMRQARYGHATVYINQLVLSLGGFNHKDDEAQAPNTLLTCEKYSIKENEWTSIAPMHQERAYFSACKVKEEFVYVFGGFQNYDTSNTIEFYNIMLDKWTMLSIQMPLKLAKYGLAKSEENIIVIAGGLLVDTSATRNGTPAASYSCVNTVYKFDCNTLKWSKLAKLNFRRTLYSNMAVKENGQIFAIGGTIDGINEVYDIRKKKWNTCQSYTSAIGQNDLQTFSMCSLNKFDDV